MDVIAHVDALPISIPERGGCLPIDGLGMELLLRSLPPSSTRRSPGGSASNVARGVAELISRLSSNSSSSSSLSSSEDAIRIHFIGMAGDDDTATEYEAALARKGVVPRLLRAGKENARGEEDGGEDGSDEVSLPTATCLCLVTPEGQRTMRTCLGAAALLKSEQQLPEGWSEGAAAVHVEGYALWREGLASGAMDRARRRRRENEASKAASLPSSSTPPLIISMDCASFEVVRARRQELEALLKTENVDVLFCNEEEAAALAEGGEASGDGETGTKSGDGNNSVVSRALRRALELGARVAVASLGPRGAVAMAKKRRTRRNSCEQEDDNSSPFEFFSYSCPAEAVESVLDTVGAGDAFAAGFLTSLLLSSSTSSNGGDDKGGEEGEEPFLARKEVLEAALRLGCAAGGAAVRVSGADPGKQGWDSVAAKVTVNEKEKARELALA